MSEICVATRRELVQAVSDQCRGPLRVLAPESVGGIGGLNEALLSNEDFEFNYRAREWPARDSRPVHPVEASRAAHVGVARAAVVPIRLVEVADATPPSRVAAGDRPCPQRWSRASQDWRC
jgi:hypothetical protein